MTAQLLLFVWNSRSLAIWVYSILHNKGCKELPRFSSDGNLHVLWGGPLYPHVEYTIVHHTRAENTTFAFRSRVKKNTSLVDGHQQLPKFIELIKTPVIISINYYD